MRLTKEDVKKIESFMLNKARDLELAYYNTLIDNDDPMMVSYALSMYQNRDGGFGHGLEPDNCCPSSSAIATSCALEMLKNCGFSRDNMDEFTADMVNKAMKYIFINAPKINGIIAPVSEDTNKYPHAIWWNYSEDLVKEFKHNPEILLYIYAIHFLSPRTKNYQLALSLIKPMIDDYLHDENVNKNYIICYTECYSILKKEGINYRLEELFQKLISDIKKCISPEEEWGSNNYPTLPYEVITEDFLIDEFVDLYNKSLDFMINNRLSIGVWDINWTWNNEYTDEYEVARIKWSGVIAVKNLYLLIKNKRVD